MKKTIIAIVVLIVIALGIYFIAFRGDSSLTSPYDSSPTGTEPISGVPSVPGPGTTPTQPTPTPAPTCPYMTGLMCPDGNYTRDARGCITGCGSDKSVPQTVNVNIKDFAFSPLNLTVKKGTKVTWINNDSVAHTVTSDSGNVLNSPLFSLGQSFSYTFDTVGSFSYHCIPHPMMKGTVVVQN